MCTMSWTLDEDGYELFFNRDERRNRLAAEPPELRRLGSTRVLAPRDGEAGGSWIAVNEYGVTIALLNGYLVEACRSGWTSRGKLVIDLATSADPEAVERTLRGVDLGAYRAFRIAAFAPGEVRAWDWSDGQLTVVTPQSPAISSSFRFSEVQAAREALFLRSVDSSTADRRRSRLEFHRSHEPERGPLSPCMHRDDAQTVSFSWISVEPSEVRMRYCPAAPCRSWPPGEPLTLKRIEPPQ